MIKGYKRSSEYSSEYERNRAIVNTPITYYNSNFLSDKILRNCMDWKLSSVHWIAHRRLRLFSIHCLQVNTTNLVITEFAAWWFDVFLWHAIWFSAHRLSKTIYYGPLFQKKEMNVNMLGASLGLQQMGTMPAQYLTQGAVPIQLLGNQLVAGSLLADSHTVKLNNQNRMSTATSQPVMTSSIMAAGLLHSSIPGGPCRS